MRLWYRGTAFPSGASGIIEPTANFSIEDFKATIVIPKGSCDIVRYRQWHTSSTQDMTDSANLEMKDQGRRPR